MTRKPVVLIPSCNRVIGQYPFHVAGKKYAEAVRLAGCLPLVVPAIAADEIDDLLEVAEGVLLTGSPSNVHPQYFGEEVLDPSLPLDPDRDTWTLPLIPLLLARGIPLFAICRGFQETNVALGGSLYQAVHQVPGQRDHRGNKDAPPEVTYGLAHPVEVLPGGLLADIVGPGTIEVNSVHGQGVNRLAGGLRIEARAPDGLVEAFSVAEAPAFNLCVQWHPEWQAAANPVSQRLFKAFGDACRAYRDRHRAAPEPDR
jgi:putative glutamine amidotransferase